MMNLEQSILELEKQLLVEAIAAANGEKTKAAELLQISFRSLRYKIDKHGLGHLCVGPGEWRIKRKQRLSQEA